MAAGLEGGQQRRQQAAYHGHDRHPHDLGPPQFEATRRGVRPGALPGQESGARAYTARDTDDGGSHAEHGSFT